MDVTVVVGTYGDSCWINLARERALPSAHAESVRTIHSYGRTLAAARNTALALVRSEFVIHLDADDELEPGYLAAMAQGSADLRAPAVRYVDRGRVRAPYVPRVAGHRHECSAECVGSGQGNWLVIGTCARTEMLRRVGGWREWPYYEDFDLWLRAIRAGATVEAIPAAVYRAHVRRDSRNRAPSMADKDRIHREIVEAA